MKIIIQEVYSHSVITLLWNIYGGAFYFFCLDTFHDLKNKLYDEVQSEDTVHLAKKKKRRDG
jgi:hypothetical protein